MKLAAMAVLARWLGPWSSRAPDVTVRDDVAAGQRVRVYGRGPPLLIAPGMHDTGPDDPRMERFARILAAAGHRVLSPAIAGHIALTPGNAARADFLRLVDAIEPAAILSVSFGSYLALAAAAERPDKVTRLIVFGGYGEIAPTLEHALGDPEDRATLVRNIGEHEDMRAAIARHPLRAELDVAPLCPRVRCPVDILHGADDATIPVSQAWALAKQIPHARVHVIGDYHHTGIVRARILTQARTLVRVLAALSP